MTVQVAGLSRDLVRGGEFPGGGVEQLIIRARVGQGVGQCVGDLTRSQQGPAQLVGFAVGEL